MWYNQYMRYLNVVLILTIFALGIYLSSLYLSHFVYPHTYLGDVDISGKTRKEVEQFLITRSLDTIKIQVNTRIYSFSYDDLGIIYYKDRALKDIFEPNQQPILKYINYVMALYSEKIIPPPLAFSQDFYTTLDTATFMFIDPQTKEGKQYEIDAEALKTQIALNFGKKEAIQTTLREHDTDIDPTIMARRVSHVQEKPVDIILKKDSKTSNVTFSTAEVKGISTVRMNPETAEVDIAIDKKGLEDVIKNKDVSKTDVSSEILKEDLKNDFTALLKKRLDGMESDIIITDVKNKTNTNGDKAKKYIEIDISDKTVYLFENGKVQAHYSIKNPLCDSLKNGTYGVKTKIRSMYSPDTERWVPYWIGFFLDSSKKTLFGIHEIPYQKKGDKEKPHIKINAMKTESCVALSIGEAEKVYEFAEVNMPVYVFK